MPGVFYRERDFYKKESLFFFKKIQKKRGKCMKYDMGIVYNAKLKEVRETVEKLGTLSFDMTSKK